VIIFKFLKLSVQLPIVLDLRINVKGLSGIKYDTGHIVFLIRLLRIILHKRKYDNRHVKAGIAPIILQKNFTNNLISRLWLFL